MFRDCKGSGIISLIQNVNRTTAEISNAFGAAYCTLTSNFSNFTGEKNRT